MTTLAGKTVLVTEASRGIGRASALELGRLGAQVLVHCSSGGQRADTVVADISHAGGKARKIAIDLRVPDGPHMLAERTKAIIGGRLDILIVNASLSHAASVEDTTVKTFDDLFAANVRAPFFLVQQLLPIMCRGSQVLLLNRPATQAAPGMTTAWASTASALDTLARCFAAALDVRGIRVNAWVAATGLSGIDDRSGQRATADSATSPTTMGDIAELLAYPVNRASSPLRTTKSNRSGRI